jgi:hypothetical protein
MMTDDYLNQMRERVHAALSAWSFHRRFLFWLPWRRPSLRAFTEFLARGLYREGSPAARRVIVSVRRGIGRGGCWIEGAQEVEGRLERFDWNVVWLPRLGCFRGRLWLCDERMSELGSSLEAGIRRVSWRQWSPGELPWRCNLCNGSCGDGMPWVNEGGEVLCPLCHERFFHQGAP